MNNVNYNGVQPNILEYTAFSLFSSFLIDCFIYAISLANYSGEPFLAPSSAVSRAALSWPACRSHSAFRQYTLLLPNPSSISLAVAVCPYQYFPDFENASARLQVSACFAALLSGRLSSSTSYKPLPYSIAAESKLPSFRNPLPATLCCSAQATLSLASVCNLSLQMVPSRTSSIWTSRDQGLQLSRCFWTHQLESRSSQRSPIFMLATALSIGSITSRLPTTIRKGSTSCPTTTAPDSYRATSKTCYYETERDLFLNRLLPQPLLDNGFHNLLILVQIHIIFHSRKRPLPLYFIEYDQEYCLACLAYSVCIIKMKVEQIPLQFFAHFEPVQILGCGYSGLVVRSYTLSRRELCAVKIVAKDLSCKDKRLRTQIQILTEMNHQCVVRLRQIIEGQQFIFLVLQLAEGGTLSRLMFQGVGMSEQRTRVVVKRVLQGLEHIHGRGVIHRDVKPDNILLMKPQSVQDAKLADFSLSAILSTSLIRKDYCGTMIYMAPEMLLGQPYSQPVDLYSLSVIMFELLEGRHPFFLRRMNSEAYVRAVTSELPVFKRRWSYLALSLYQRLARPDPRYRYTASQALMHPWITGDPHAEVPLSALQVAECQQLSKKLGSSLRTLLAVLPEPSQPTDSDYQHKLRTFNRIQRDGQSTVLDSKHLEELFKPFDFLASNKKIQHSRINEAHPRILELNQFYGNIFVRKPGVSESPTKRTVTIHQTSQTCHQLAAPQQEDSPIQVQILSPQLAGLPSQRKKVFSVRKEKPAEESIELKFKVRGGSVMKKKKSAEKNVRKLTSGLFRKKP